MRIFTTAAAAIILTITTSVAHAGNYDYESPLAALLHFAFDGLSRLF